MLFKPVVPSSVGQLQALCRMRHLADRFDNIVWRVRASIDLITGLRVSIATALEKILTREIDSTAFIQVDPLILIA
jgi:hypothetical protein